MPLANEQGRSAGWSRRRVALVAAAGIAASCLLLPVQTASVRANDDAGVREFLMNEARRRGGDAPRHHAVATAAAIAPAVAAQRVFDHGRLERLRDERRTTAVPAEFASLPRAAEPVRPKQSDTAANLGGRAMTLIFSDPTLRPGDIVVFPDGPKVFRGAPGKRHARADFQDIDRSGVVPKDLRRAVVALTRRPGTPAQEARRRVAAKPAPVARDGVREASAAMRVVYPGLRQR